MLQDCYNHLRNNARRRSIPFQITLEEFEIWCGVTGYLELRGIDAGSMTIDRDYDYDGYGNKMPYSYSNMVMRTKSYNCSKPPRHMPYIKLEEDIF